MTFNATNLSILQQLQRGNNWLRAVLCTLARRGIAFRLAYPIQAQYILDSVTGLPYYKGGQFLFDLMEWEDFMLDGPPAPLLSSIFNIPMSDQVRVVLSTVIKTFNNQFNPSETMVEMDEGEGFVLPDGELPKLESNFYIYQEVVLGLIASQLVRSLEPKREKAGEQSGVSIALDPEATVIMPGDSGTVQLTLVNTTESEQKIHLSLEGFPLEWSSFAENNILLIPGEEKRIALTIQAPEDDPSLAHLYSFKVFGSLLDDEEPISQAEGTLLVQNFVPVKQQESDSSNAPENGSINGRIH